MSHEHIESIEVETRSASAVGGGSASPAPDRPGKSRLLFLVKLAIGVALCVVIVANVDWRAARGSLAGTGWSAAAMFAILVSNVFLSAYRWRLLLSIHGVEFSTLRLSRYYFVALFLNNFLPTSIGGDGYRIYKTIDNGRSKASAVIAVLMERLTGFATLVALGVGAALLLAADALGQLSALMGAVLAFVIAPSLLWRLRSVVPGRLHRAVPEKIRRVKRTFVEHIDDYIRERRRTLAVLLLSILFHLCLAFAYFVILRYGIDQPITLLQVLTVLTLTTFVAVLPISFNGLGVYEGTFIYLLSQYGVPPDASVVPMILNRGMLIALSLVGAGVYLLETAGFAAPASARVDVGR